MHYWRYVARRLKDDPDARKGEGKVICSLVDVYRNSSLFRILRDPAAQLGKCGRCEYTKICGGSRSGHLR